MNYVSNTLTTKQRKWTLFAWVFLMHFMLPESICILPKVNLLMLLRILCIFITVNWHVPETKHKLHWKLICMLVMVSLVTIMNNKTIVINRPWRTT